MTTKRKKKIIKEAKRHRTRMVSMAYKEIKGTFLELKREIASQYLKSEKIEIDLTNFSRSIKKSLLKCWKLSADATVKWSRTLFGWSIDDSVIESISSRVINEYNRRYAAKKVGRITETTRKQINAVIEEGQRQGLNINDIARNICSKVEDMSRGRAKTIARTETSNSVSITTHATAEEAEMSRKTWIHAGSGKTDRDAHLAMDGTEKKMDEYFNLPNGSKCLYPHDQANLGAGDIINCGCMCIYE